MSSRGPDLPRSRRNNRQGRSVFPKHVGSLHDDSSLDDKVPNAFEVAKKPTRYWRLLWEAAYPHHVLDHLNLKSLKVVFRSWFQLWTMLLLTIIDKPANWLGPSGYFVNVGGVVEISGSMSIANGILTGVFNVGYVGYTVLCAAVANAITWRIRGYPSKQDAFNTIYNDGLCKVGDEACAITQVYAGRFLETRCTVVHIFAIVICLTSAGLLAVKSRFLTIPWVLMSCTVAAGAANTVVLPWFDPWLSGRGVVVPIGISSAARFVYSCVIFPTSSTAKFFREISATTREVAVLSKRMFETQDKLKPSDPHFATELPEFGPKMDQIHRNAEIIPVDHMLSRWEVAYFRFDTDDVDELRNRGLRLIHTFQGFQFFYAELYNRYLKIRKIEGPDTMLPENANESKGRFATADVGQFERDKRLKNKNWHWDDNKDHDLTVGDLDELYAEITGHYHNVIVAGQEALDCICDWFEAAGKFNFYSVLLRRYRRRCVEERKRCSHALVRTGEALQAAIDALPRAGTTFENYASKQSNLSQYHLSYLLELDAYYHFVTLQYTQRIKRLASHCLHLDEVQPMAHWISPLNNKGFHFFGKSDHLRATNELGGIKNDIVRFEPRHTVQARNPDSSPPKDVLDHVGAAVLYVYHALKSPDFLFCVKRALMTIASLAPLYFRTTCHLYFNWNVGWASLMTALTVAQNAADGVYGFLMRLAFTFSGCLAGMVGWYICAGSGDGNPYGFAAVMAVLYLYLVYHRHFAHHMNPISSIVLGLTVVVVSGNSWSQAKRPVEYVKLKPGWNLAWVRFVCVALGLALGFIGSVWPHAYTAKKSIRNVLGGSLAQMIDLQSHILNFSMQRFDQPCLHANAKDVINIKVQNEITRLNVAERLKAALRYEPSLSGKWPGYRYALLIHTEREIAHIYWLIYLVLDEVGNTQRIPGLLSRLGWTSPDITQSTYSLLYIVSRALVTGQPLPAVSPGYLSEMHLAELKARLTPSERIDSKRLIASRYLEPDGQLAMVAVILSRLLYERLDGTMLVVKGLVGENFDTDTRVYELDIEKLDHDAAISESEKEASPFLDRTAL